MQSVADVLERVRQLHVTLVWNVVEDRKLWRLVSTVTNRVMGEVSCRDDGLYSVDVRHQNHSEKFTSLEAAQEYHKFQTLRDILRSDLNVYLQ